jgi:hypothetical protein
LSDPFCDLIQRHWNLRGLIKVLTGQARQPVLEATFTFRRSGAH